MKAVILNSGMGTRMGVETSLHPKCMTSLCGNETILSRQLRMLSKLGINEVVITTGYLRDVLISYCENLNCDVNIQYIHNDKYDTTNYIYSLYLARNVIEEDILLLHGDLVFEESVLEDCIKNNMSCMVVDSTIELPQKDFKAVICNGMIKKIGTQFFENAVAAQPMYKITKEEWKKWLDAIVEACENGRNTCYAEDVYNLISDMCHIEPYNVKGKLCQEIDTLEDRNNIVRLLESN